MAAYLASLSPRERVGEIVLASALWPEFVLLSEAGLPGLSVELVTKTLLSIVWARAPPSRVGVVLRPLHSSSSGGARS